MNKRDIVVGLVLLAALAGAIFYFRSSTEEEELPVPETLSTEDELEARFNIELPEDLERAELSDQTGGNSSAIATRSYENGSYELTLLADVPDDSYTARLSNEDGDTVNLGSLRVAKGGYLLEYQSSRDLNSYDTVEVMSGGETILQGDF
ncbi:hypothetical protein JXA63_00235 [Candidatus Woesebacteria bacterium]|nr:hypothetical protein [Candidatus Woesebacteria bacterium]